VGRRRAADVYAAAALVVSRAGAGTVNECCQLGVPALYIPLPGAAGDEQTANAKLVGRAGGCAILPQTAMTPRCSASASSSCSPIPRGSKKWASAPTPSPSRRRRPHRRLAAGYRRVTRRVRA